MGGFETMPYGDGFEIPPAREKHSAEKESAERFWSAGKRERMKSWVRGAIGYPLGFLMGAAALQGINKEAEWTNMSERQDKLAEERQRLLNLEEKEKKIKELFGDYEELGFAETRERWFSESDDLVEAKKNFSVLSRNSTYEDPTTMFSHREEMNIHPETEKIQTNDFYVTKDGKPFVMEAGDVDSLLRETFPHGWISGEIMSVNQVDTVRSGGTTYGLGNDWVTEAVCSNETDRPNNITFFKSTEKESPDYVFQDCLPHELAHANDPRTDAGITLEERTDFLLSLADRVHDTNRYHSLYVESIKNKDKKLEFERKVTEYWAEICSQYFRDPGILNVKDFQLVDWRVHRTDPTFDAREAGKQRQRLVHEKLKRQDNVRVSKILSKNKHDS